MNLPTKRCIRTVDFDEVVDQVLALKDQEDRNYLYRHFLSSEHADGTKGPSVILSWREKICQWSYNVVDHFDLSREVVAVSVSLFDRFIATQGEECDGNLALLTSLTTLHIAIKLHDCRKIRLSTLANLSRGQFVPKDIEQMEWKILAALEWKLHPPTQYAFISLLLKFLPQETKPAAMKGLNEVSKYLTELAVCDSFFVDKPNSKVAFAAILNVMEDMNYSCLPGGLRARFLSTLTHQLGFRHNDPCVMESRARFRKIFPSPSSPVPDSCGSPQSVCRGQAENHLTDNVSMSGMSSLAGSSVESGVLSFGSAKSGYNRSRANSIDSKGSCRDHYRRRSFIASVSPMARCSSGRGALSSSPIVAGVQ